MQEGIAILVVEDERPISSAIAMKLQKEGFTTECAYDGEEALTLLREKKFDLVLLDLMLPKKDGFAVLEAMREEELKVLVIVSSNLSQKEDTEKALQLGAVDYFVKSETSISEVIQHIKKALSL